MVPWLRETGIVKHIARLKKDEIKAAIALPSSDREGELWEIINAMGSLLKEAHSLCFDGTECMLTWLCRVVLSRFQSSQVDMVGKTRAFDPYKEPTTSRQTNDHDSFAFVWAFTLRVCMINYDSFALLTTIRLLSRTSIIYKLSLATRLGHTFLL